MAIHQSTLTFPAGVISATRQTRWVDVRGLRTWGVAIHTANTGAPNGVYSFEGSNDPVAEYEVQGYGGPGQVAPASTAAKKFAITVTVVQGSSLTLTGGPGDSAVLFEVLPRFMRVVYTFASGGAGNSPSMFTCGESSGR